MAQDCVVGRRGSIGELQAIGVYTIPVVSFVGRIEDEFTADSVPLEVGVSRSCELASAAILGDTYGMLKLLVQAESRLLFGVHVFGSQATELVHMQLARTSGRGAQPD